MKFHTVIENDIVISDIWANAQDIGFADIKLMITPLMGMLVDYDQYTNFPIDPKVTSDFIGATNWRIKNFPLFFLHKSISDKPTSVQTEGLGHRIEFVAPENGVRLGRDTPPLRIQISNTGTATWLPSGMTRGAVNIGVLATGGGKTYQLRSHLSDVSVEPGSRIDADVFVAELPAGQYDLEIDLVSEHVCWFHEYGSETVKTTAVAT